MCIKKEYKCYKGKENEECCNARVREALRNRTYSFVLILGIALMIFAVVIKTSDDAVFVNQVSFAGTITSIILSVIAIWMSITGERSTNEIKTKVSESVDKLLKTSNESDKLVTDLSEMLSGQNESYNKIKNQMESILSEVNGVKTTIESMSDSFMGAKESPTESLPNDTFLLCKNIVEGIPGKEVKKMLCESLINLLQAKKDGKTLKQEDVYNMIDAPGVHKNAIFGIVVALNHNGFFKDGKNYENTKKLMDDIGIEESKIEDKEK